MEFKGTKGKWVLGNKEINNGNYSICAVNHHLPNQETSLANALLISKAPEMLEMLKDIRNQIEDGRTYITKDDIDRLIKQATEL